MTQIRHELDEIANIMKAIELQYGNSAGVSVSEAFIVDDEDELIGKIIHEGAGDYRFQQFVPGS